MYLSTRLVIVVFVYIHLLLPIRYLSEAIGVVHFHQFWFTMIPSVELVGFVVGHVSELFATHISNRVVDICFHRIPFGLWQKLQLKILATGRTIYFPLLHYLFLL